MPGWRLTSYRKAQLCSRYDETDLQFRRGILFVVVNFLFQGLSLHVLMLIPGDVPAVLYRSPLSALEEHRVDLSTEASGQRYLKLVSELFVATRSA